MSARCWTSNLRFTIIHNSIYRQTDFHRFCKKDFPLSNRLNSVDFSNLKSNGRVMRNKICINSFRIVCFWVLYRNPAHGWAKSFNASWNPVQYAKIYHKHQRVPINVWGDASRNRNQNIKLYLMKQLGTINFSPPALKRYSLLNIRSRIWSAATYVRISRNIWDHKVKPWGFSVRDLSPSQRSSMVKLRYCNYFRGGKCLQVFRHIIFLMWNCTMLIALGM